MTEYAFVSCDIVGHSGQTDLGVQERRIAEINRIVRRVIDAAGADGVVWASGGDGGHVALRDGGFPAQAIELIRSLRAWSDKEGAPLRVVASYGGVVATDGADGRVQLVGHGINLAGRLLQVVDADGVFATDEFRAVVQGANVENVRFHDCRIIELPYFGPQSIHLLSVPGEFTSVPTTPASDDRVALEGALREDDAFEALYRSKRLLQLNPDDRSALAALQTLAGRPDLVRGEDYFAQLILDRDFGADFIRGAELIERRRGDVICRFGDEGTTMFLVVRGKLAGSRTDVGDIDEPLAAQFEFPPGKLFGELAVALGGQRTATIWCRDDSALLQFSYDKLKRSGGSAPIRRQLDDAVDRTAIAHLTERIARTSPFLGGKDGPLETREDVGATIRRFAELVVCRQRDCRVLKPTSDAVRGEGLYFLVSGAMRTVGTDRQLEGSDQPLVYADIAGEELTWREDEYTLIGDVKLLAIRPKALKEFGSDYWEILRRLEEEIGRGRDSTAAERQGVGLARGQIFISYSHADRKWLRELTKHLQPYVDHELMEVWDDTKIEPGTNWLDEIRAALDAAKVAVLLVSPDFLESRFVKTDEMPVIFRKAQEDGLVILWIPVRWSSVSMTPINAYQAVLNPSTPLDGMSVPARNKKLVEICEKIAAAVGSRAA